MANDEHLPLRAPGESAPGPLAGSALAARVGAALGGEAKRLPDGFDAGDPLHVDAAARLMLRRFYERADGRCFDLLVELTADALSPAALATVRAVGLPIAPDVLLGAFYGALFCDTRPAQVDVRRFREFAERSMEDLAEKRVAWIARRPIPHLERLPSGLSTQRVPYPGAPDADEPPEDPVAIDALVQGAAGATSAIAAAIDFEHLGFDFTWLVETLVHRLDRKTRVLLRASEIEGKSPASLAEERGMSTSQLADALEEARATLSHAIEDACARLATRARRAGCTLSGKRPDEITAEDVARHLVACDACVHSLDAVTAQREALVVLGGARDPAASRVATLVADAQARGREALATFLAELARACLLQIPEVRERSDVIVGPAAPEVTRADVSELARRAEKPIELPSADATERWLGAARASIAALGQVEGETERVEYYRAQFAMASRDWISASRHLRAAIGHVDPGRLHEASHQALVLVLSELGDHDAVLALCHSMVERGIATRAAWFGLWRSQALLGRIEQAEQAAASFRESPIAPSARDKWAFQIKLAARGLADAVGRGEPAICESLGLHEIEGGAP